MEQVTDPADPRRCVGRGNESQCRYVAEPGSDRCSIHGGRNEVAIADKRQYLLTDIKARTRLAELSEHEEIKSLRDEIALARILCEKRFNMIKTDTDLVMACGPLNQLLLTIERLVKTANSIETNLGVMLTRVTVLRLAQAMCEIVLDEIQHIPGYEAIIDRISARMVSSIVAANNNPDVKRIEAISVELEKTGESES